MAPDLVRYSYRDLLTSGDEDECLENCWGGLSPMLGGQGTGRRSLYPEDDGGREELQGETVVVT